MLLNRSYNIRHENGLVLIPEIECIVDASLDWDYGEPVAIVDDLLVESWDSKQRVSLLFDIDPVFTGLAHRILEMVEDDESVLVELVEDYGDMREAMLADKADAERDRRMGL